MASVLMILPLLGGCLTPCPFHDDLADGHAATTPSVDGVRESGAVARLPEPIGDPKFVFPAEGTVLHRPLYFEDPREITGSDDGAFAWTGEDYAYIFIGPVRFLLNAVTMPAEMVAYPPWDVMASDGHASRKVLWWWVDSEPAACAEPAAPAVMVVTDQEAPAEPKEASEP